MLKDKKVWAGIVLTVVFLWFFLRGMSLYGVPGESPVKLLITRDAKSLHVYVNGMKVVALASDKPADATALAKIPATLRWVSSHPLGINPQKYNGIVEYDSIRAGVAEQPADKLMEELLKGTEPNPAYKFGPPDWLGLEFPSGGTANVKDDGMLVTHYGEGGDSNQARGPELIPAPTQSLFLISDLRFGGTSSDSGVGFFLGDNSNSGIMICFSDTWSAAWVELIDSGRFAKELGRVSGIVPAMKRAKYVWLIPSIFFLYLSLLSRAFRWRILFGDMNRMSIPRHFGIISIGFFGNAVLPARAGEFIRAWLGAKENKCPFTESLATLVVDRIFDMVAMVTVLVIVLQTADFPNVNPDVLLLLKRAGTIGTLGLIVLLGFLGLLTFMRQFTLDVVHRFTAFLSPKIRESIWRLTDSFADGLTTLRSPSRILWCMFHTALVWIFIILSEYYVIIAFGLGDDVGLMGSAFVMVVICFAIAAPSSPGYVGIFHTAIKVSLMEFYGVAASTAMGCAIILHASQMLSIIAIGAVSMLAMGVSFHEIKEHTQSKEGIEAEEASAGGKH